MLYKGWQHDAHLAHEKGEPHPPFPVEVKPHLYEEIIDYANQRLTCCGCDRL